MPESTPTICFIGAGNMAQALIGGLLAAGIPANRVRAHDPGTAQREKVAGEFGIGFFPDNATAADGADVIVLAVKPQVMDKALAELGTPDAGAVVISIAAGVTLTQLQSGLPEGQPVVRAMPNTPALYQAGITGAVASSGVGELQRRRAEQVLQSVGPLEWVSDESLMDAVTAVSGSGPAYFFLLAESLARAGAECGLPEDTARRLAVQTAAGAGRMLTESGLEPDELRRQVTSPGGTTAAALESFESAGFKRMVNEAVQAAFLRGRELGKGGQ